VVEVEYLEDSIQEPSDTDPDGDVVFIKKECH